MRELKRAVAHFPNPRVRLPPDVADMTGDACKHLAGIFVNGVRARAVSRCGLHQVPIDVELRLLDGGVACPNRPRSPVAIERQFALAWSDGAIESVEHFEAGSREGGCVQKPPKER